MQLPSCAQLRVVVESVERQSKLTVFHSDSEKIVRIGLIKYLVKKVTNHYVAERKKTSKNTVVPDL